MKAPSIIEVVQSVSTDRSVEQVRADEAERRGVAYADLAALAASQHGGEERDTLAVLEATRNAR